MLPFPHLQQNIFLKPFPSVRPKWLGWLELDGYNEELGIAFEYQGLQHYELCYYNRYSEQELKNIQERDAVKKITCQRKGILLICVPYWVEESRWIPGVFKKYRNFFGKDIEENLL